MNLLERETLKHLKTMPREKRLEIAERAYHEFKNTTEYKRDCDKNRVLSRSLEKKPSI